MIFVYGGVAIVAAVGILGAILVLKVEQAKRASRKPGCMFCGNTTLRVSSPHGLADELLTFWDCIPHRCEICSRRQYRLTRHSEAAE